jgi:hypothetical protein
MSRADESIDAAGMDQQQAVPKPLNLQLNAKKRVYFRHRGVVTDTREVPNLVAQPHALQELAKLQTLVSRQIATFGWVGNHQ